MKFFTIIFSILFTLNAYSKIKVVTSTPDLAWVAQEIGKELVEAESLLTGHEDPHFVDALPLFIHKTANADMVTFIGLDLEIGWLPKVLTKTGKKNLQPNGKGHCNAGRDVKAIDIVKEKIDRSHGHVHASGNPHYHLSTDAMINVVGTIGRCLINIDEANAKTYLENSEKLIKDLEALKIKVSGILSGVKDSINALEYHKEFSYFFNDYGIKNLGSLEVVPGSPPSAGQLAQMLTYAKDQKVNLVIATPSAPDRILNRFFEQSGIKILRLPLGIIQERGTSIPSKAYENLLVDMAEKIKSAIISN